MGLNAKQKEAVEYLEGPLLVLAGPGTGKTQLLSEKVAYILKNTDTAPENILCVTFTESGASNMRERLKTIVGRDGLKVNISTYHVLGQEILAQYRQYSETYDRNLNSAIDEVTQYKIVREIQKGLKGTDILRGDSVKDIISVISEAKSSGLTADDLAAIARQNLEDSKVISDAISPYLQKVVPKKFRESYDNAYAPIYEILQNYTEVEPLMPRVERSIAALARDLKSAIIEAESSEKITALTAWRNAYFEKDEDGNYRLKDRIANKKLQSIAHVMAKYEDYLREHELFDFDDMIEEAVKALREDEGFRLTMSERYQVIMLDEFQDTNPSQFQMIKYLTAYEKPLVMAVGDDDQAIYEFQGALSTNLTDFQKHYNANVVTLVENYRSTQEILDFSHAIIEQAPDRFGDKILTAHQSAPAQTQIERREFLASDMEYAWVASEIARLVRAGVPQSEIAVISYKTKYFMPLLPFLKAYPEVKIAYEKQNNLLENERIRELLMVCKYVWELAHEQKVDTPLMEILSYPWLDLPMIEVVRLAGVARRSHKGLFEVMSEAGTEKSSANEPAKSADQSAYVSSDVTGVNPSVKIAEVAGWLANLVAKANTEPLEIFLDYVIGVEPLGGYTSPFLKYYTSQGDYEAWTLYEDLAALKGKLTRHFGDKALRLGDLIEMVSDYEEAEMPINTTSPYKDADEAIQILSAHKAKGLEFEHVFMISVDHVAWGKGKGNNNMLALPKNLAFIRHTGTTDGEKLRILYVALTRAKSHLYLTNSLHDFNGKSPERLEYLEEYTDKETGKVVSPFLPSKEVITDYEVGLILGARDNSAETGAGADGTVRPSKNSVKTVDQSAYQSSEITGVERLRYWLRPYAVLNPDMRALYLSRLENYRMSATALTGFIDVVYGGPVEFFKNSILNVPREPETESLAYGNLVHAAFEAVTNRGLSDDEAVRLFLDELEKRDLPLEVKSALREKGPADLAVALKRFDEILRSGKAEVDLGPEHLVVDDVPITGKIDHLVIDEDTKTLEIYDFKTSGYHKEKWGSHATLYKYMLQLLFYKMLLNNSREYSKYTVTRAHILFVVPDRDGVVHDKVYEFNEGEEAEFRALLSAVYAKIADLSFMDDSEIFIEPDKTRGLKDIKEFVEKIRGGADQSA